MPPANCVAIFLPVLKVYKETNVSQNNVFDILVFHSWIHGHKKRKDSLETRAVFSRILV